MSTTIQLTPFEQELLQLIHRTVPWSAVPVEYAMCAMDIVDTAYDTLGVEWGGGWCRDRSDYPRSPQVNRFLGRLRKKGLVQDVDLGVSSSLTDWSLTEYGCQVLGIDPWAPKGGS